jgi:hypothetical protein
MGVSKHDQVIHGVQVKWRYHNLQHLNKQQCSLLSKKIHKMNKCLTNQISLITNMNITYMQYQQLQTKVAVSFYPLTLPSNLSTSAPALRSTSTIATWPLQHAAVRGVLSCKGGMGDRTQWVPSTTRGTMSWTPYGMKLLPTYCGDSITALCDSLCTFLG